MAQEQKSLFDDFLENSSTDANEALNQVEVKKFDYEIRRSKRRKKSVGAYRERGKTIIVAPIRMSNKEVQSYAAELIAELNAHDEKVSAQELLEKRARHLATTYLDVDVFAEELAPVSIKWVTNQNSRWGSCSHIEREIRISHRLQGMPQYVIDAVIFHELVHLIVPDHSASFYSYLDRFSQYDMAKEYLAGYSFAQQNYNG
jgi:predicted metal-dependent hydrolase